MAVHCPPLHLLALTRALERTTTITIKTKTTTTLAERVAASRSELDAATLTLREATEALEAAVEVVATLRQNRRAGDTSATASDLATARAAVSFAQDDLTHAETRLSNAQRNLINDDTSLADVIAPVLAAMPTLAGVEVVSTTEAPQAAGDVSTPVLHLVQQKAAEPDPISGRVSGEVELIYSRPAYGQPLPDADDLADALNRAQVYSDAFGLGSRKVGEHLEDRARISARGAWTAGLPVIARPNGANWFAQGLAGRIADYASRGRRGLPVQAREGGLGSTTALTSAVTGQGAVLSETSDEANGKRTTTVLADMAFASGTVGNPTIANDAREFLGSLVGQCESGLGRIASADLTAHPNDDGSDPSKPLRLAARVEFTSSLPG